MSEKRPNGAQDSSAAASPTIALPDNKKFFAIPRRFGNVPVAEEPLGYDRERRFEHHYPRIELPFQLVDTVETGAKRRYKPDELFASGLNRLFFGDCLHVMRMLPSECVDLIYIDPPFFSGRNYNILFGDKNEVRSFSDIWEGGMPGYLIWLNARLYEMKRLLKQTGSIYVHLDWHAVHYVKVEMDKIFGTGVIEGTRNPGFRNEIVWHYYNRIPSGGKCWDRKTDSILFYTKSNEYHFEDQYEIRDEIRKKLKQRKVAGHTVNAKDKDGNLVYLMLDKRKCDNVLRIPCIPPADQTQRIGYPTQKPEALLERIIEASSRKGDVVADFFCGGGTTSAVAQKLGRRWIGYDISRVAVALTSDRIARILAPNISESKRSKLTRHEEPQQALELIVESPTLTSVADAKKKAVTDSTLPVIGYAVEHWGIYEIGHLVKLSNEEFRSFVLACYGARKWTGTDPNVHGVKGNELLWVAGPKETDLITANDVKGFAQAVMKSRKPEERQAIMIGWSVDPKARSYAEQVMALGEQKPIQFIKMRLWPLAGEEFKDHVTRKHDKYKDFFDFILPPDIPRIGVTRIRKLTYRFDVSEARSMNTGGRIVNVQWDFDFRDGIFSATQGYQLCRKEKKDEAGTGYEGDLTVEYEFEGVEPKTEIAIACRVQDDLGGEGMTIIKLKVE
jgi:DNA modification methylase